MKYLSIIIVSLLLGSYSFAHDSNSTDKALIQVTSVGKAKSLPDQAELNVTFTATKLKADKARKAVDKLVRPFLNQLESFDIQENSLDSSQTTVHPQYDYWNNQRTFKGYQVNRAVNFKLNTLSQLESLVELITSNSASELSNMRFTLKNPRALKNKALKKAIVKANKEASILAEGFGVTLGKVHRITHSESGHSNPQARMMAMSAEMADTSNSYHQKEIEVKARIEASFSIH